MAAFLLRWQRCKCVPPGPFQKTFADSWPRESVFKGQGVREREESSGHWDGWRDREAASWQWGWEREAGGGEQKLLSWFWGPQSGLWGVPSTSLSSCSATAGETLTPQMQDCARGPGAGPHLAGVTAGPHRALWEEQEPCEGRRHGSLRLPQRLGPQWLSGDPGHLQANTPSSWGTAVPSATPAPSGLHDCEKWDRTLAGKGVLGGFSSSWGAAGRPFTGWCRGFSSPYTDLHSRGQGGAGSTRSCLCASVLGSLLDARA